MQTSLLTHFHSFFSLENFLKPPLGIQSPCISPCRGESIAFGTKHSWVCSCHTTTKKKLTATTKKIKNSRKNTRKKTQKFFFPKEEGKKNFPLLPQTLEIALIYHWGGGFLLAILIILWLSIFKKIFLGSKYKRVFFARHFFNVYVTWLPIGLNEIVSSPEAELTSLDH